MNLSHYSFLSKSKLKVIESPNSFLIEFCILMNDLIMGHIIFMKMSVSLAFVYVWMSLEACNNIHDHASLMLKMMNVEILDDDFQYKEWLKCYG